MRLTLIIIILSLNIFLAFSQKDCDKYPDGYIPKNLNDALAYLNCDWSEKDKLEFKSQKENDAVTGLHMGTGRSIRNDWGLWEKRKNSLVKYFSRHGIYHPDDISSIILTSFHRKLNNKEIDLDKQVESYKSYWKQAKAVNDSIEVLRNKECEKEFETFRLEDTIKIEYKINVQGKNVWIYRIQKYPDLNEKPDCYVTGIVKAKKSKTIKMGNYILSILITDICGHKEAIYSGLDKGFRVGETYDFFSLNSYKISKE